MNEIHLRKYKDGQMCSTREMRRGARGQIGKAWGPLPILAGRLRVHTCPAAAAEPGSDFHVGIVADRARALNIFDIW
jgi:hypothetical protein